MASKEDIFGSLVLNDRVVDVDTSHMTISRDAMTLRSIVFFPSDTASGLLVMMRSQEESSAL